METKFVKFQWLNNQPCIRLNWLLISFTSWKSFWTCLKRQEHIKKLRALHKITSLDISSLMLLEPFQSLWWENQSATTGWRFSEWLMLLDLLNHCNSYLDVHFKSTQRKDKMILLLSLDLYSMSSILATSWLVFGYGLEWDMLVKIKKLIVLNHGSINVVSRINLITLSIYLLFIGFSKLSQL